MSKAQQQQRGQQKRERKYTQQRESQQPYHQQQLTKNHHIPADLQQSHVHQKLAITAAAAAASESEETMTMTGIVQQNNSLSNSNSSQTTSVSTTLGGGSAVRMDDDDPIFILDEDIANAGCCERTRHYTADFDPTASDDDEFPKEIGDNQLHGGRAYSVSNSNRFPPRVRHSGRSGHIQNTTGIFQKLHGQYGGGESTLGHHYGLLQPTIIPASLPIQISRGFNWPPRELVGSLSEEEDSTGGGDLPKQAMMDSNIVSERGRAKTTTTVMMNSMLAEVKAAATANGGTNGQPKNESEREDMYGKMQAYSRSIQPEDDPERIFGERPHRRYSIAPTKTDVGLGDTGGEAASEEAEEAVDFGNDEDVEIENIPMQTRSRTAVRQPHHHHSSTQHSTAHESMISTTTMITSSTITTSIPVMATATSSSTAQSPLIVGTPRVIIPASLRG